LAGKNSERVKRIIKFIEKLIIPSGKGEGKPFKLRHFQKKFIADVYGRTDKVGNRQVRRAILSMARKNGKSVLIAALALVHLIGPEAVTNGEIYSAANDREQAALIFKYAAQMVRADAELLSLIKIVDSTKTMVCFGNGSIYRAVSAEAGTKFGLNPTVVIFDELAQAKNRNLYDALDTSMAARLEPLFIVISTQSNDPQHILSQLIDDGLSGNDPTTICHLFAVPDDSDDEKCFTDKKLWMLANPALGDFRSLSEMRTAAKRAQRMPSFEAAFRNLYLNQRVDAQSPLIPRSEWMACQGDATIKPGEEVYFGLDLSGKTDLTALVAVSAHDAGAMKRETRTMKEHIRDYLKKNNGLPDYVQKYLDENGKYPYMDKELFGGEWKYVDDETVEKWIRFGGEDKIKAWFWKPKDSIKEHETRDRVPYSVWEKQGIIKTTPGRAIQYSFIAQELAEINKVYAIVGIAFDRYRIDDLMNAMGEIGLDCFVDGKDKARAGAIRLVPWGQGYASMTQAVEALEGSILDRRFIHDGNPCLTWNFSNAMTISDAAGNRKLDKSKTRFRIDGAVACAMAVGLKSKDLKEVVVSAYEGLSQDEIKKRMAF